MSEKKNRKPRCSPQEKIAELRAELDAREAKLALSARKDEIQPIVDVVVSWIGSNPDVDLVTLKSFIGSCLEDFGSLELEA